MFACSYGAAFGAIQHLPRIVPGLPEVAHLARAAQEMIVSKVQSCRRWADSSAASYWRSWRFDIVSRRKLLRVFQIPGLVIVPFVFLYPATDSLDLLKWGIFVAGFLTVAQFSFWGNYLPRVYPTYLRGTGESFAANIGGRMLGTSAALLTTNWPTSCRAAASVQLAYAAARWPCWSTRADSSPASGCRSRRRRICRINGQYVHLIY